MTRPLELLPIPPVSWTRALLAMALAIVLAHIADVAAWEQLRDPRVNEREWGRLLRSAGYVPTWILGAAALWLASARAGHGSAGRWRAGVLLLAPAIAGGLAELMKIVVRRQRPGAESAAYLFRPYDLDFWSTRGLGMSSSHTAVAFGAAAVLARCFPGTAPVWYLLAVGCGATRVLAGAHYLSDTVVAAALGWLVAEGCWRWAAKKARP